MPNRDGVWIRWERETKERLESTKRSGRIVVGVCPKAEKTVYQQKLQKGK